MVAPQTGFPTFEIPNILPQLKTLREIPVLRPSWGFNFETCEIVTDGLGHATEVDGFRALVIWCVVAVLTHRYDLIIYDPQFGTELPEALALQSDDLIESAVRRTIVEALSIHESVASVEKFSFTYDNDVMYVDFDVLSVQNDEEHIRLGFPAP